MSRAHITRDEIAALAKAAGLKLAPQYFDELVEAYHNVEPMLWRIRQGRSRADEPAHTYDPRKFMPKD